MVITGKMKGKRAKGRQRRKTIRQYGYTRWPN